MTYCPNRGDIVWVSFSPQVGHEQAGHRPALIVSPEPYNRKTGLALFCPISSHEKGYPFEVKIPDGLKVSGVVLADHVKNFDWRARNIKFCAHMPVAAIEEVIEKLKALIDAE